jgi:prophage tail gpP-like protein
MTISYPQAAVVLRVIWEDFKTNKPELQDVYTMEVLPKRVSVSLNNYKEADTFEVELDYRIFPLDPRFVRSCQITIHIENMEKLVDSNGKAVRIKPRAPSSGASHNTVLMGFVDTSNIDFNDTTKTILMKGRDFTSLYADIPWGGKAVSLSKPVDKVIEDIISQLKTTGDIKVDNRTGISPLPILANIAPDLGELAGTRGAKRKESVWDVVQEIAAKAALIAYIELDKLVLTIPQVLRDPNKAVNFIFGHNLKSLQFERKLGRSKGFNVRVRSIVGKTVLVADIPKEAISLDVAGKENTVKKQTSKGGKIQDGEEAAPYYTFAVSGVASKDALIKIGENIYEEMSRQEIEGKFETHDMESFDNYRNVIDLSKLRNGAAVAIDVSPQDMKAMRRLSASSERLKYLLQRGYTRQVASVIANNFGKFATPFYAKDINMEFSIENGWRLHVDFINRIETKNQGV